MGRKQRRCIMALLVWIFVGLMAGLVARRIMPGPSAGGFAVAIPLCISAAVLGGLLGSVLTGQSPLTFEIRGLMLAGSGAMLAVLSYRANALRTAA
jgi:uncharacterized membrane protein YeaQ/YmgE (transglycosylase-associated protein family)